MSGLNALTKKYLKHESKSVIHNWQYMVAIKLLEYIGIPQLGKTLDLFLCII